MSLLEEILVVVRSVRPKFFRKQTAQVNETAGPAEATLLIALIAQPSELPIERGLAATPRCERSGSPCPWSGLRVGDVHGE